MCVVNDCCPRVCGPQCSRLSLHSVLCIFNSDPCAAVVELADGSALNEPTDMNALKQMYESKIQQMQDKMLGAQEMLQNQLDAEKVGIRLPFVAMIARHET